MDTVRFIEERNRMCKSFDNGCTGCPAFNTCNDGLRCCAVSQESTLDAMTQIAIVEKWSVAHPRKTRQSVFLEQYPETIVDERGVIYVCPMYISADHRDKNGECGDPDQMCIDCRIKFWAQEVK